MSNENQKKFDVIVIGGGQGGLASGYHLNKIGANFLVIDSGKRIGDSWRQRWDSLALFTPGKFNTLPGDSIPLQDRTTKDQMADYLEDYAERFSIPVKLEENVINVSKEGIYYRITTSQNNFLARHVIVATGNNPLSKIPSFASELDPGIYQIHSSTYRNPEMLPPGDVLVVGAGVSGIEIAKELSQSNRRVHLSGEISFTVPKALFLLGRDLYWSFISNVLTVKTFIGRKARPGIIRGGTVVPALVDTWKTLQRLPRLEGVSNGQPRLKDGNTFPVSSIIWCTGFKPDFSWIDLNVTDRTGWPVTERGISRFPGLYFVGMPFQFGLTSGLVGGVGRDAEFVVGDIKKRLINQQLDRVI
ncbi:MAG TPA: NAD(P)-binding domain-containing protein [Cyclobacteriaceae bacterium]|nr:NAD(P)-binding domain-containing protein [Cyclobacteriaceae bacterium]